MKSSKRPSKEPALPSQDETRRANVLREEMISQYRTLGEAFSLVREDVNSLKPRFDVLEQKVDVLELAVRTNSQDISALKVAVQGNTEAIRDHTEILRGHTEILRGHSEAIRDHTEAIHSMQSDFKTINQRVERLESKVGS